MLRPEKGGNVLDVLGDVTNWDEGIISIFHSISLLFLFDPKSLASWKCVTVRCECLRSSNVGDLLFRDAAQPLFSLPLRIAFRHSTNFELFVLLPSVNFLFSPFPPTVVRFFLGAINRCYEKEKKGNNKSPSPLFPTFSNQATTTRNLDRSWVIEILRVGSPR